MTDEIERLLAHLSQLSDALRLCEQQYADARQMAIPPDVQARLRAIDDACVSQIEHTRAGIAAIHEQLKAAVVAYGRSVKGYGWQVIYNAGRVRWDDAWLQGYAATHDDILQARIESEPYTTIRRSA
jgi:hypothetical protein